MCLPAILDPSRNVCATYTAFNGLIHHRQLPLLTNPNFALQVSPFCSKNFTQILCSVSNILKKSAMHTFFEWNICLHSTTECGSIEWKTAVGARPYTKGSDRAVVLLEGRLRAQSESFLNRRGNRKRGPVNVLRIYVPQEPGIEQILTCEL
jgi:hypothetical protein